MSLLLTSLVLCLFQTTEPELELDQSLQEYRQAMHYIDVRGDYAKGVEILERIALADDVLAVPGQSSWILAQSTRATTLAGEGERVLPHLSGIRSAARGTRFEEPVKELLLSFSAQGAGLDPEFFAYFKTAWKEQYGPNRLIRDYGRDLLPYLDHVVETPSDYRLHERLRAISMMMVILDSRHAAILERMLLKQDFFASKMLILFSGVNNNVASSFIDEEARLASSNVLLHLSKNDSFRDQKGILDGILGVMNWTVNGLPESSSSPAITLLKVRATELIEGGNLGKEGAALRIIGVRWKSPLEVWKEMALHFAQSEDLEIRESMRMELTKEKSATSWIRKWSASGDIGDELRLCLQLYQQGNSILLPNPQSRTKIAWHDWARQSLQQNLPLGFSPNIVRRNLEEEDKDSLLILAQSKHPITRILAASTLQYQGWNAEAFSSLSNLDEDTSWASLFLDSMIENNQGAVDQASLQYLLPLVDHPQLGKQIRQILNSRGGYAITVDQWIQYDLNPTPGTIGSISNRASNEKDLDSVLWIMLHADLESNGIRNASFWLANQWPNVFLDALDEIETVGRRKNFEEQEFSAWQSALREPWNATFLAREKYLESLIFGGGDDSKTSRLFDLVAERNPLLAVGMAHRHRNDPSALRLVFSSGARRIPYSKEYVDETSGILLALLQNGQIGGLVGKESILESWISLSSKHASPIFRLLWDLENPTSRIVEYRIRLTAKTPSLRHEFQAEIVSQLEDPKWTKEVCNAYMREGATEEILDACLNLLQGETTFYNGKALLNTISKIDDPRVIEVLLSHLNDPRQGIPEAASAGLDYLRKLRTQKQEWAAWASGNGAKSPVAALLNNLKDPEKEIRLAAIASLGTLRSTEALPALVNLLRDSDEEIKDAARKALGRINAEPKVPEGTVEQLMEPHQR